MWQLLSPGPPQACFLTSQAHQPCPRLGVWRNARWKVPWKQKTLHYCCCSLAQCSFHPVPLPQQMGGGDPSEPGPSCKWGGPADSPHSAITFFPRDLNPAVISSLANLWGACKQSLRDGVGRPGQDTEWRLVATPCLRPRAGIEASALLLTKPVSRDQCLEGLGQEQGGFCVLM